MQKWGQNKEFWAGGFLCARCGLGSVRGGQECHKTTSDNGFTDSTDSFFSFFFHRFCLNFVVFLGEIGTPEARVERTN